MPYVDAGRSHPELIDIFLKNSWNFSSSVQFVYKAINNTIECTGTNTAGIMFKSRNWVWSKWFSPCFRFCSNWNNLHCVPCRSLDIASFNVETKLLVDACQIAAPVLVFTWDTSQCEDALIQRIYDAQKLNFFYKDKKCYTIQINL
jgi:hypothetical protein